MDYKSLIKEVLSESDGLKAEEIEIKIIKIAKNFCPPERVDYLEFFTALQSMVNEGILKKEKNKYFLNI